MDMMNCKPELHGVEQIRRDKFRVEQMNDFSNTWDHHHQQQHQNIRNSNNIGMIGTLQNQNYQDYITTFMDTPQSINRDLQFFTNLRTSDSYEQAGVRSSNVGDVFSSHYGSRNQMLDRSHYVTRDTNDQFSMMARSEVSYMEDNQKGGVTVLGQNNHQNVVTLACSGTGNETLRSSYYDHGSSSGSYREELMFLPSSGNQPGAHHASQWNHGSRCKESLDFAAASNAYTKGFPSTVNVHKLGPLGPFTGYASVLKRSRFLEPAQKMLEEFCVSFASKIINISECLSMDDDNTVGFSSSSSEPLEPKNRLKREKLLFLQEEVCKRHKLYNHQLQTVVSSFESVAGLSTAAPYVSIALKQVSRSFKALRTAISEQLKQLSSQYSSPSDNNGFQKKQKSLVDHNVGYVESMQQHHIWRPHRGLPEHAVTVLRAWLFDHFLHPYPTDTDKQVLATQTGLSRNQVSNWFINARVRLWKPMVEEIHMLETKSIENRDNTHNMEPSNRADIASCSNPSHEQPLMDLPGTKRARLEYVCGGNRDMMGFNRGLGNVSLTLGLRHGVDNVIQTQTQDHQFGTGGQMFHDFVS